jgi:hypothetical protein
METIEQEFTIPKSFCTKRIQNFCNDVIRYVRMMEIIKPNPVSQMFFNTAVNVFINKDIPNDDKIFKTCNVFHDLHTSFEHHQLQFDVQYLSKDEKCDETIKDIFSFIDDQEEEEFFVGHCVKYPTKYCHENIHDTILEQSHNSDDWERFGSHNIYLHCSGYQCDNKCNLKDKNEQNIFTFTTCHQDNQPLKIRKYFCSTRCQAINFDSWSNVWIQAAKDLLCDGVKRHDGSKDGVMVIKSNGFIYINKTGFDLTPKAFFMLKVMFGLYYERDSTYFISQYNVSSIEDIFLHVAIKTTV